MQVQPPMRSQSFARSLAVCLNTADVVVTRVPAGGIGLPLSLAQLDTNNVPTRSTLRTAALVFVRVMDEALFFGSATRYSGLAPSTTEGSCRRTSRAADRRLTIACGK